MASTDRDVLAQGLHHLQEAYRMITPVLYAIDMFHDVPETSKTIIRDVQSEYDRMMK